MLVPECAMSVPALIVAASAMSVRGSSEIVAAYATPVLETTQRNHNRVLSRRRKVYCELFFSSFCSAKKQISFVWEGGADSQPRRLAAPGAPSLRHPACRIVSFSTAHAPHGLFQYRTYAQTLFQYRTCVAIP
eukprot:308520-Rhodomonas_salina.1